jgi:hypothetical protein
VTTADIVVLFKYHEIISKGFFVWKANMTEVEGLDHLSVDLKRELESLEDQFHVSSQKLKQISERFEEELKEGLEADGANIVSLARDQGVTSDIKPAHECDVGAWLAYWTRAWAIPYR